jgi:3-oxoadipate enol-lactonase
MLACRTREVVLHYAFDEPPGGPEDAPVMVLANSLGSDLRIWDRVVAQLAGQFRFLRYDKRGHGLSETTPAPYLMDDHIGDLIGLLDALDIKEAIVGGVSVGGMIAQGLAARQPKRVRGLVLCDTAHRIGDEALWDQRIRAIQEGGIEALADAILERWFTADFRKHRADELALWRHMLVRTPVDGYTGTCAAIRDTDLGPETAKIDVPTLVVCGAEDGATPPDLVREMAALIPKARFNLIESAAHLPCIETPEILSGMIAGFVEENQLGTRT